MEPKLLFKDDFENITSDMEIQTFESFDNGKIKYTFLKAFLKHNRPLWFIKLEAKDTTYYLWIDKKHFDRFRKLLNKGANRIFSQELLREIFFNPDSLP